jgi:protein involved in ribonucleotide reduction
MQVVFYSLSGNTRRFAERLGFPLERIAPGGSLVMDQPYVLLTPTYSGKVPKPVLDFLQRPENRNWIRGVVTSGNTNFGADYARAGRTISEICGVPHVHSFELTGLPEDLEAVREHIGNLDGQPTSQRT